MVSFDPVHLSSTPDHNRSNEVNISSSPSKAAQQGKKQPACISHEYPLDLPSAFSSADTALVS